MEDFDLVIIGSGSAGTAAAMRAEALGAKTALVEKDEIGGNCLDISCVPSRSSLREGELIDLAEQKRVRTQGSSKQIDSSFIVAVDEAERVAKLFRRQEYEDPLKSLRGLKIFRGSARFTSSHEIDVDGKAIRGEKFLIATGALATVPPISGIEETEYLTSENFAPHRRPPRSLIVLGAGVLGLEFAQMFWSFGTKVTIAQRHQQIMTSIEPEVAKAAQLYFEDDGINILTHATVEAVFEEGDAKKVRIRTGATRHTYSAKEIFLAGSRWPNTNDLGLEIAGVAVDSQGAIITDDEFVTSVPHIRAAGDVTGDPMFENVAKEEGFMAAENALTAEHLQIDYDAIPFCVFTSPEMAQVGILEEQAQSSGHNTVSRTLSFDSVPRARIDHNIRGLIKMTAEEDTRRILGVSIVSDQAGDIINEAAMAIKYKLTVEDLSSMIHAHPTLAEVLPLIAQTFARDSRAEIQMIEKKRRAA